MSDESEYDCGEDILEDEDQGDCDYDFGDFCVEPQKRAIGCCFECWLFQEVDEADRKAAKQKAKPC